MPEYLSPGVYVEEIDAGPKPIEGVSTSTTGAVGVTAFGPTSGKPELVTSFAEFIRKFGGFIPEPDESLVKKWALNPEEGGRWWQFPLAVKGFFDNGGQRLYVKRVFSGQATSAQVDFGKGLVSEIVADAAADATSLKLQHCIGIDKGKKVTIYAAGTPPTEIAKEPFTVIGYDAATLTITLERQLGKEIKARNGFVEIQARKPSTTPADKTLTIQARARGNGGNDLQVRIRPMSGPVLNLLQDPATGGNAFRTSITTTKVVWVIEVDDETGLAEGDKVSIKGTTYTIRKVHAATKTFEIEGQPPVDVLKPDEAIGKKLVVKHDKGFSTKVKTALSTGGDTIDLTDISKLAKEDHILLGGKEFTIVQDPTPGTTAPEGSIKISPPFPEPLAMDTEVKKIPGIVSAGTRRLVEIDNVEGLDTDSEIVFVPTGKKYKLTAQPQKNVLQISPAIPVGRDWESKAISTDIEVTEVKTAVTAIGDTIEIKDISKLKKDEKVVIKGSLYTLVDDPTPGAAAPEGNIKVSPNIPASAIPIAVNEKVFKRSEHAVIRTAATWRIDVDDATGIAKDTHTILNGKEYIIAEKSNNTLTVISHQDSGDPWPTGTTVRRQRPASSTADPAKINVANAALLYNNAIVELDNGETKETAVVKAIAGNTVELTKQLSEQYFEGHKLRVVEAEVTARQMVSGQVQKEETFSNLRFIDDKSLSYLLTHLKTLSSLIEIESLAAGFPTDPASWANLENFPIADNGTWADLDGGEDKLELLSADDFVGEDRGSDNRTGIQALEDIDEIAICLAPGVWASTVHNALIQHCELLKDRFAILDPQDGLSIEGIRAVREILDTKYAALYYPWIEVRDPSVRRNVYVAPSGHMAGIYARVDVERGVHKAPANEVIRGITKIAQDVTKREQDVLNPKGINALRFFPGRGNRVWGARTVSSDASWKYVNVRRLFIFVEESIDEGTQFVVFEPNDEPLWARVRQTITNFLTTVWRSGALEGTKPDEAFFVKCDRTTMTQDDIDNGRLICVIGIAPVKPAEFVIFRIQQKTRESQTA